MSSTRVSFQPSAIRNSSTVPDARGHTIEAEVEPADDDADDLDGSWPTVDGFGNFIRNARHAVLTAAEEVALADRIDRGHLAERVAQQPQLPADVVMIFSKIAATGTMRSSSYTLNVRLIINIAKRASTANLSFKTVQEGMIGLDRAVDKLNATRGFKFSTYATRWVRQSITRAIATKAL